MRVGNPDNDSCVKVSLELESLLQHHFQHRQQAKRVLKDRLRNAELEIAHLRQSVSAYSNELKAERLRNELLARTLEDVKKHYAAELTKQDTVIQEKLSGIDAQARLLVVKTEECERRLQSLQQQETELLNREKGLKSHQASIEAGIISAQKQAEAERLRMQYAREKADEFLEEARLSAMATEERRYNLENLYNLEMLCFDLEKKEAERRIHIMQEEIMESARLISSRRTHVSIAETKAAERIRLHEQEFVSKKDVVELREKELHLRHQREQQYLRDEKERIAFIKEAMRRDYNLILENIRFFGKECSTETEQLQVDALKDLEKLLSSVLDDRHLKLDKKL